MPIDTSGEFACALCELVWLPVADKTAKAAIATLLALFGQYGTPLVIKSNNDSPFIAHMTKEVLEDWDIAPLFSPPRTPQYNGSCEAGIGTVKRRTARQAARHGRPGQWTCGDMEAARQMTNELNRSQGHQEPSLESAWNQRLPIHAAERRAFQESTHRYRLQERLKQGYPPEAVLGHADQSSADRVAISRALREHGILRSTRRRITPPITATNAARVL